MKCKKILVFVLLFGLLVTSATPAKAARYYYEGTEPYAEICWENGGVIAAHNQPITLHVDGNYLPSDVDPITLDGRTLLPLRTTGEALGCKVDWDANTRTISALNEKMDRVVSLKVDKYEMFVGKISEFNKYLDNPTSPEAIAYVLTHTKNLDRPPVIINNRTLLPLRAFAEAFDANVTWNQKLYDVSIDTSTSNAPAPNIPNGVSDAARHFIQKYYVASTSADSRIGSWQYKPEHGDTWQQFYIFVSELNDSYQFIVLETTGAVSQSPGTATVEKESAYLHSDKGIDLLMATVYHNLVYFNGPYFGPIPTMNENDLAAYFIDGNTMYRMGQLNMDTGESAIYPLDIADKYVKF